MHDYTVEDLILYLYKETSSATTTHIEKALQNNWTLREKLAVLKAAKERLDMLIDTPRTESVLSILKYAAKKDSVSPVR